MNQLFSFAFLVTCNSVENQVTEISEHPQEKLSTENLFCNLFSHY